MKKLFEAYRKDLWVDVFSLRGEGDDKATRNRRLPNQKHPEDNNCKKERRKLENTLKMKSLSY